jgi:hypothetical protein
MAVRLDPAGNVYVSGTSSGYRWRVINTLKYSQSVSGVAEVPPGIPASFTLFQNYPNPFNPRTTIRYTLPKRMHVRVAVYDLLGRVVSTLADGVEDPGPKSVSFEAGNLSSGVYFYQVRSSDGLVASKKMMVLR